MKKIRAVAMFASLVVLTGCARPPLTQSVEHDVLTTMQPVEVRVGIAQPELYAAFVPSTTGLAAAATCGVIPGIGILLAAACGGALGAVDAGINASRAKSAEETIHPLKDQLVELNFDQQMRESILNALREAPEMQVERVEVTKDVKDQDYNELFIASQSGSVMFVTVDYHLSPDFSTFELSTRSLLFPRSSKARAAAKLQPIVQATAPDNGLAVAPKNSVYRASITYRAKLVTSGKDSTQNVAIWNDNNGRLLRASMHDGIAQMGRLVAESLQRKYEINGNDTQVKDDNGIAASQVSMGNTGSLLRYPDGSLQFNANLEVALANFDVVRQAASVSEASAQAATPNAD
ncbi:hypothetical protein F6X37_24480 [Paraburkholderia sp. 31.1]|uniref:hypothetical protein n=2 Tax=unclassified Paraburkholderia TaxID=2615204 RepID=UPI001655A608|nr:hypothetical protein [Paraburkholderia sp. 31.1]MBC8724630.1 hypothetical protein [Paraburkholderia sp. 31.1]